MPLDTINVYKKEVDVYAVQINRPTHRNSLNKDVIKEMSSALTILERHEECKSIIIEGVKNGPFSIGMDFDAYVETDADELPVPEEFQNLLSQISMLGKFVITVVEGEAIAGGVGILAASDYVIATQAAMFQLTEAIWGLQPFMIMPYLVKRCGYWPAYKMTVTAKKYSVSEATKFGLVDVCTDDINAAVASILTYVHRIAPDTIKEIKTYFKNMSHFDSSIEMLAIKNITNSIQSPRVKERVEQFVMHGRMP